MTRCPNCGEEIGWFESSCKRCGTPRPKMQTGEGARELEGAHAPDTSDGDTPSLERQIRALRRQLSDHASGLAGVLSAVLPGLGQIYAGNPASGIPLMIAWVIGIPLYVNWCLRGLLMAGYRARMHSGAASSQALVGLLMVAVWVVSILHAMSASKASQKGW
ncbi:MAG: hypothetical protein ACM3ZU_01380 [Bacteroidota bacterium]